MKKSLLALAVLGAFAGVAQAQTSVTVYGSFDGGLRYVDNFNAAGDSRTTVSSNGTYNSNRLGFRGVESLGGGMNARFNLETGFNTGTGGLESASATGNNFFWNRTATVGLGGAWGGIDIGHQYSISFKTIGLYDPFNYKYTGIIPLAGIAAGNASTSAVGGTRFNNDIQYTGTFGPITARAEYSFGEITGGNSQNASWAGGLSYANGPLVIGGAYTQKKIASTAGALTQPGLATSVAPAATAASPDFDDKAWTLGAAFTFGAFRVSGGYNDEKLENAVSGTTPGALLVSTPGRDQRQRVGWLGLGWDITPALNLTTAWYQTRSDVPSATTLATVGGRRDQLLVGASYAFSKRTNFYTELDFTKFRDGAVLGFGTPITEDRQTGFSVGINHLF